MTKAEKIKLFYGIFLSLLTVVVGVLFIVETANVYYSAPEGQNPFTAEIVGKKLGLLMIPTSIWIAAIVAGFVLSVVFPVAAKFKNKKSTRQTVGLLSEKLPAVNTPEMRSFLKLEVARLSCGIASAVLCTAAATLCVVHLCQTQTYVLDDVNKGVLTLLKSVLPWIILAFFVCIAVFVADRIFASKQLTLIKRIFAESGTATPPTKAKTTFGKVWNSPVFVWVVRGILLAVAVTFIIVGIINGGAADVLRKAINICTECIGLG